jgi:GTP-binding protein EngB required for normal cell division
VLPHAMPPRFLPPELPPPAAHDRDCHCGLLIRSYDGAGRVSAFILTGPPERTDNFNWRWSSPLTAPSGKMTPSGEKGRRAIPPHLALSSLATGTWPLIGRGSPVTQRESLNSSQALHLLSSCKYVDQLLSEIESILSASESKSPFPRYGGSLSPVQAKVVRDYIGRIRAQMLQVLKSQGIEPPEPPFEAIRSIRVNLEFADIAFDECRPKAMRGYGEVPASLVPELNGLVQEMKGRLRRLEHTSNETEVLTTLERVIRERGLVEFRPALEIILDRLESNAFQIAVFGRVSSGKSSLLNHILGTTVLPVGVTPITAVPTRIMHGQEPKLTVTYAGRKAETAELDRLAEFVSEQFNPGNAKHVTRIVVELPAHRLQDGVVFVDTPGLGSLATAGAAETLAYLPSCDLGVVLIDAGSTLNQEDLATLQDLYAAAIPALVVLSKADVLRDKDRQRVVDYTSAQIASQLGLQLAVYPVSAQGEDSILLDRWFEGEIQPLCDRHQELAQKSVRRKVGALQESVEAALRLQLDVASKRPKDQEKQLRAAEAQLRRATGKFEEVNAFCLRAVDEIRELGLLALSRAASEIADGWFGSDRAVGTDANDVLLRNLTATAAEGANQIFDRLRGVASELSEAVAGAAVAMGDSGLPDEERLDSVVKEMPRFDPGPLRIDLEPDVFRFLGRAFTARRVERQLSEQIGDVVNDAFQRYGRLLESWVRRTLAELRRQFDARADTYRAQLERLGGTSQVEPQEEDGVRRSLDALSRFRGEITPYEPMTTSELGPTLKR